MPHVLHVNCNRHASLRTDIAKSQNRSSIRNNGYQIALAGVIIRKLFFIRQFVLLKYVVKFYSILVQRKNHVNLTKILQSGIFVAWTTDFLFICVYNNISF